LNNFHIQLFATHGTSLGLPIDDVCRQLASIPRLQLELDGSFVWVGDGWQLDGMLYDRDERLQYVDLKGSCPKSIWTFIRSIFVLTQSKVSVIRLPEGGLYDLQTFETLTWS
jgi:hypothetical protein